MITPSFGLTATERVLPKLALDFTTASLDSRVTFTRSGNTATVVNSSGLVAPINADLPRFDFDPVTLACKGLLIEEARTNAYIYSQDFNDGSWTKSATTIGNDVEVSPDGTQNADKLIETATTATHLMFRSMTPVSGTAYTFSVYAKAAERIAFRLNAGGGFNIQATFNLSTVTATLGSGTATSITPVGNGWYRCTVSGTSSSTSSGQCQTILGTGTYAGDGTSGMYFWGAQLEVGAFATSYIPTTNAALTRNADLATMTGTNFSDWFNATEGTLFTQASNIQSTNVFFNISDGTISKRISSRSTGGASNRPEFIVVDTTSQADIFFTPVLNTTSSYKMAAAYKVNDFAMYSSNGGSGTDNSGTIPTVNQVDRIGLNCIMQKVSYYPQRLTNAELRSLVN